MGAKAWFITYFDEEDPQDILARSPKLNRDAALDLAKRLFPNMTFKAQADASLANLNPEPNVIHVGCYDGLAIVAHEALAIDRPTDLDPRWLDPRLGQNAYLHLMHSVVDWFAFGLWHAGRLQRALSVSPDSGIIEERGTPLTFEAPFWAGEHAETDDDPSDYPLPFHPLELAEEALLDQLGFQFEGYPSVWTCDPEDIPIAVFVMENKRRKGRLFGLF